MDISAAFYAMRWSTNHEQMNLRPNHVQRANTKTYFLKTFGCQMNVYDSERMAEALRATATARPMTWATPIW